jgi:hypothetical protein
MDFLVIEMLPDCWRDGLVKRLFQAFTGDFLAPVPE